jgi:hypothetical protein
LKRFGKLGIFWLVLVGTLAVFTTIFFLSAAGDIKPQYCRNQAVPVGYSGPPPKQECFATQEETMVGLVNAGSEKNVKESFSIFFRGWAMPTFVNDGKPYCAFMLTDVASKTFKAECADSMNDLEAITQKW